MKCIVLLFVLSAVCAVYSVPVPQHGMFFYQQAGFPQQSSYYRQPAVHRMYLQYQQPYRAQRRSAAVPNSGISAYVAGNQVAASGSLLKDDAEPAADEQPELLADEPVGFESDDGAVSIAEAYPAEPQADPQEDVEPEFEAPAQSPKVPKELAPPAAVAPAAEAAPAADEAPVAVAPPKNKVTIQLDSEADDEDDILADQPVYNKGGRRPANGGASNPINTFFPINFGNTNGGAIAVANSYSTGAKGGARSHAIAYGTPAGKNKRRQVTAAAAQ